MDPHPPKFRNTKPAHQMEAEQLPRLPEEIIEEIMSRLPVKSLLKFRCVSKSWCSLISSKKFIRAHLENSTKNTNFTHHRIILNSFPPQGILKQCSVNSLLNEQFTDSYAFDNPMIPSGDSIRVVGCCNGLVCILVDRRHFLLWNPSTKVCKRLPDLDKMTKYGYITKYGFGFVVVDEDGECSCDYKVFGFLSVFLCTGRYLGVRKVYSLKTNSWKNVEDKDGSPFDEAGKFVNGKLHWDFKYGVNSDWDIVSFDLKSNMYGSVEHPSYDEEGGSCPTLGVLDGCLCVLCDYRKTRLDVWVMKEYGVRDSWNKVATVPYLCDSWKGPFSTPLCVGPNGEILFVYGYSNFVVYHPGNNTFSHPQTPNFDAFRETDVYVESLVSPFLDGEREANEEIIA